MRQTFWLTGTAWGAGTGKGDGHRSRRPSRRRCLATPACRAQRPPPVGSESRATEYLALGNRDGALGPGGKGYGNRPCTALTLSPAGMQRMQTPRCRPVPQVCHSCGTTRQRGVPASSSSCADARLSAQTTVATGGEHECLTPASAAPSCLLARPPARPAPAAGPAAPRRPYRRQRPCVRHVGR